MENIWKSHDLISFSWHLKFCALPAEWKSQRNPPAMPWRCAVWGNSRILPCGEQWQLQHLSCTLALDLQLQLMPVWILAVIGIATVIVLDVWSEREKALPWGTAPQCHMLQARQLGAAVVSSHVCKQGEAALFGSLMTSFFTEFYFKILALCCDSLQKGVWVSQLNRVPGTWTVPQTQERYIVPAAYYEIKAIITAAVKRWVSKISSPALYSMFLSRGSTYIW